jgi:hypothetical protein
VTNDPAQVRQPRRRLPLPYALPSSVRTVQGLRVHAEVSPNRVVACHCARFSRLHEQTPTGRRRCLHHHRDPRLRPSDITGYRDCGSCQSSRQRLI